MNELLFIRHAQTDMVGRFCGRSDPAVNAHGEQQIDDLVASLRTEPVAAVFTSDLQRSLRTARALAESHGVPCIPRTALREIEFGAWDGLSWREIEKLDSEFAQRWLEAFPNLTPPGGESVETFEARVMGEMRYLLGQAGHASIAIVTHAGVMRVALRNLCGVDEKTAWALTESYCCIFRYAQHAPMDSRLQGVFG